MAPVTAIERIQLYGKLKGNNTGGSFMYCLIGSGAEVNAITITVSKNALPTRLKTQTALRVARPDIDQTPTMIARIPVAMSKL